MFALYVRMVLVDCRHPVASSVDDGEDPDSGCETDSDLEDGEGVEGLEVTETAASKSS